MLDFVSGVNDPPAAVVAGLVWLAGLTRMLDGETDIQEG